MPNKKEKIRVHIGELSCYVLDDTIEGVIKTLQERAGGLPLSEVYLDFAGGGDDDNYFGIFHFREETPEEGRARIDRELRNAAYLQECRRRTFEELKAEFEPATDAGKP